MGFTKLAHRWFCKSLIIRCVCLDPVLRWPISGVGARSAASSGCLRALSVRQFGETVGTAAEGEAGGTARRRRNCRHCRRRRSRRRQALPLMSRSLRSFDFRLLNRNAPDVPWDGTAGAKNGEIAPGVPFLGTSGAIAMSDAPGGGVLRAAGVGYACVGCAGVRCSARTSAKSLTGTGEKRPKVFRQRGQAVMICSGLLAVRLSMAPRVMGSRSS